MNAKIRLQECFGGNAGLPHPTELVTLTADYVFEVLDSGRLSRTRCKIKGLVYADNANFTAIKATQNLKQGQMNTLTFRDDLIKFDTRGEDRYLKLIDTAILSIANGIDNAVETNGPMVFRRPVAHLRRNFPYVDVFLWTDYVILTAVGYVLWTPDNPPELQNVVSDALNNKCDICKKPFACMEAAAFSFRNEDMCWQQRGGTCEPPPM